MYAETAGLGRRLNSVACRYRQPSWRRKWPPKVEPAGSLLWRLERQVDIAPEEGSGFRSADLARLEAVLFLSKEPVGSRKLAQLASLADGTKARTLVRELNRRYDDEQRSFRVVEVAGGFQLMTRPKFAPWLRRLHGSQVEVRLSGPAMETLAVVAYRQPVLRADIEAIRGVQCGEILRQLMERDLVRIVGRSEDLGRPFLYGTTRQFLQVFGLSHVDELRRPELLQQTQWATPQADDGDPKNNILENSVSNRPVYSNLTGGDAIVKTAATLDLTSMEIFEGDRTAMIDERNSVLGASKDDEFEEDDEFEDDEDDEDDDDDDVEDDELEDEEWEEVDDEDDVEYEDEEEEDEDDWEDDDDDWEDDDDEEEEEEEEDGDWE